MGWIDKVNKWLLKRIHPWAIERVKTDREGTTLIRADGGSRFIRWSDVQEIAVLKQPDLARGCFALGIHAVVPRLRLWTIPCQVMRNFAKKSRGGLKA
jgi:hypothetical protein